MLIAIWVTPENQLARFELRGSSVLPQDFRGPQMACRSGEVGWSTSVHKGTDNTNWEELGVQTHNPYEIFQRHSKSRGQR